jgi:hypothetical protein
MAMGFGIVACFVVLFGLIPESTPPFIVRSLREIAPDEVSVNLSEAQGFLIKLENGGDQLWTCTAIGEVFGFMHLRENGHVSSGTFEMMPRGCGEIYAFADLGAAKISIICSPSPSQLRLWILSVLKVFRIRHEEPKGLVFTVVLPPK